MSLNSIAKPRRLARSKFFVSYYINRVHLNLVVDKHAHTKELYCSSKAPFRYNFSTKIETVRLLSECSIEHDC